MECTMTTARHLLAFACFTALAGTANAQTADSTALSLYRSDNPSLYASQGGDVDAGYAVVREQLALTLAAGTHDVTIGNLPNALDAEIGRASCRERVWSLV